MTFEEFAIAGKERGFSKEDVMLKASEYEKKYGSFDMAGSPSSAIASMNSDIMPSNPEQREVVGQALTIADQEQETARRFYDTKFGVRHDDVLLQARMDMEYGDGSSPEMVNQYNKQALAYMPQSPVSDDEFLSFLESSKPIYDYGETPPDVGKASMRVLQDLGTGVAKTTVATGEALIGLTDLVFLAPHTLTGGRVALPSQGFRLMGYNPKMTQEFLSSQYSQETQEAIGRVGAERGVLAKLGAVIKNPEVAGTTVMESLGPMLLGGGVARGMKFSPMISAALGEGFISGGMSLEDVVDYNAGDPVTPKQAGLIAASTVATSLISIGSSSLQKYIGLDDIDVLIAGGGGDPKIGNPLVRAGLGAFFESFVEELPQSVSEQIMSNIAQDNPWNSGIDDAAALGIVAGAAMGVGSGFIGGHSTESFAQDEVVTAADVPAPYTFGDANTIRNTKSDIEIEQEVATLPEQAQDAARDAFLNPDTEKVNALNQALFEDPTPQEAPAVEAPQEVKTIDDVEVVDEADVIGFSTEKINEARQERGEEELTEEEVKSHQSSMDEAMSEGMVATADNLAERVLRSAEDKKTKTYQMDDKEVASLGARTVELRNERIEILKRQNGAMESGDQDAIDQTYIELEQNAAKSDQIENALKTSGTASGRANSMMASMVNRFTYDVVSLESAARTAKGESLTPQETADIQDVADRIATLEGKIADVKEQLATGEFKETKRRIRQDEPREVTKLRTELALLQREARNKIYDLRKKSARDWLKEIATLPRSLMATADMSYGLRQGLLPSFAHPKIAASAWGKAFKSFFSQKTAAQIDLEMRDHPLHTEIAALGTHFSSLDSAIEDRTEFFASNLAEKIPAFGKVVMASERNMVTGINLLRQGLMVDFLTKHPDASTEAKKAYARYVNIATGRGEAKLLDRAAEELSIAFFAPRFAVSRIQAPVEAARLLKHPELRAEIVKQWASYLGTGMTVLALAKMAGADVEDDPESSDWGKIVIDNKHIDIWGGIQQPMRILAKAVKGGVEQITEGETDVNTISDIGNFLKYKLSPPVAIFNELLSGEDVIGRETEEIEIGNIDLPESATVFVKNVTPLIIQSAVEAYQEGEDPAVVAALAIGEGLGLSIGVYDKKTK